MSYILEALSKSEQERSDIPRLEPPVASAIGTASAPYPWRLLLPIVLAMSAGILCLTLWSPSARQPLEPVLEYPTAAEPSLAELSGPPPLAAGTATATRAPQPANEHPTAGAPKGNTPPTANPLPLREGLSAVLRQRLPTLDINVHVYSENPAARFAMINLKRHQEGSVLDDGLILEEITADGLILRIDGQRFRVPLR